MLRFKPQDGRLPQSLRIAAEEHRCAGSYSALAPVREAETRRPSPRIFRCAPGALPVVSDASALELATMYCSGGRRGLGVELAPADLIRPQNP